MAYGLRDGASPIIGLIESYRQERVIRDKMKMDERRFEEGLKQQKFENDLRIDDMQYRAERAGVEDSQWNKEYKRLTDAEAEDQRRYNAKVNAGADLFAMGEGDIEPVAATASRIKNVVTGYSGEGTLKAKPHPTDESRYVLMFETPEGEKPFNNRDASDNNSPPASIKKSDLPSLVQHGARLLKQGEDAKLDPKTLQAYLRAGVQQGEDNDLRIATPEEQAANLKQQKLLDAKEARIDGVAGTLKTIDNMAGALLPGFVEDGIDAAQSALDPKDKLYEYMAESGIATINAGKSMAKTILPRVLTDAIGLGEETKAEPAAAPTKKPPVTFGGDGTPSVGLPPKKDDSDAYFKRIEQERTTYRSNGGAEPSPEQVEQVAVGLLGTPTNFSTRYKQKLGKAVALGVITAEQAQNRLDTGSFSLSKQGLVELASDLKVDKARYAKNIAEMEKISLEMKSKGDWTNDVSSSEYKAVRGNVGTSIGYVVDGLGFKKDDKNYATGVLNTAVDAFFGSGNYAKAIFNRPDGVVVMQEALKDMAYDIKSGKPVESATPYITTIAKKYRRQSANVFRELAASGVSAEGEYKKSVIEMNGKQYEVPNSTEAITLYGEYLFNKRLAENGGAELSEAQYNEFLVDLYKTFKAE